MLTDQTALLLIDFQVDFIDPNGRFHVALEQVEPMLASANKLIAAASSRGMKIVYIGNEYGPRDLLNLTRRNAAIKGSPGAKLDTRLTFVGDYYFPKDKNSAFTNPKLDVFLQEQGIKRLVLTGVYATACVRGTALDGLRRGYQVSVVSDCVAAANDQRREAVLQELDRKGVRISTSAALLAETLPDS